MPTVGASLKEFIARKATLTLNGVTIAAGKNFRHGYGYEIQKEPVFGSAFKRYLHGCFDGDFECEYLYISDDTYRTLSKNIDTTYTLVSTDTDTQVSPATTTETMTIKVERWERAGPPDGNGVIRARIKGAITAVPS